MKVEPKFGDLIVIKVEADDSYLFGTPLLFLRFEVNHIFGVRSNDDMIVISKFGKKKIFMLTSDEIIILSSFSDAISL